MKNIPQKIYLNTGKGMVDDFKKLSEVTWCKDRLHKNDIEYTITTAPIDSKEGAEELIKELVELKKYHINPYNLGDMGRVGEIINTLEKTITTHTP